MPRTPKRSASALLSSTFTLATLTWPAYSRANASTAGSSALQGPHHGAQKSTSTGSSLAATSLSQFDSVTSKTCATIERPRVKQDDQKR